MTVCKTFPKFTKGKKPYTKQILVGKLIGYEKTANVFYDPVKQVIYYFVLQDHKDWKNTINGNVLTYRHKTKKKFDPPPKWEQQLKNRHLFFRRRGNKDFDYLGRIVKITYTTKNGFFEVHMHF